MTNNVWTHVWMYVQLDVRPTGCTSNWMYVQMDVRPNGRTSGCTSGEFLQIVIFQKSQMLTPFSHLTLLVLICITTVRIRTLSDRVDAHYNLSFDAHKGLREFMVRNWEYIHDRINNHHYNQYLYEDERWNKTFLDQWEKLHDRIDNVEQMYENALNLEFRIDVVEKRMLSLKICLEK